MTSFIVTSLVVPPVLGRASSRPTSQLDTEPPGRYVISPGCMFLHVAAGLSRVELLSESRSVQSDGHVFFLLLRLNVAVVLRWVITRGAGDFMSDVW